MALGGFYNTGTITIGADRVSVTGVGTLWKTFQIEVGDWLLCAGQVNVVGNVINETSLTLQTEWIGTLPSAADYSLILMSWLRFDPSLTQAKLRELLAQLNAEGSFVFTSVAPPDPALGENGQWALKTDTSPWRLWYKEDGVWIEQATPAGMVWRGAWNSATAYAAGDGVSQGGSSYIAIAPSTNQAPPNATYWNVIAQQGAPGTPGTPGAPGAPGTPGLLWRGTWAGSIAYAVNDGVQHSGASYICVTAHTSSAGSPPPNANWNLLAGASSASIADDSVLPAMLDADTAPKQLLFRDRLNFVSRGGDTLTGDLTITKPDPSLILDKGTGANQAVIYARRNGENRWAMLLGDSTADPDAGANAGSHFRILRYGDAGFLDVPFHIERSTGLISIKGNPTQPLEIVPKQYFDGAAVRYDSAQTLTAAQQTQARKNIYAAPFDALGYFGMQVNGGMSVAQETVGGGAVDVTGGSIYVCDLYMLTAAASGLTLRGVQTSGLGGIGYAAVVQCMAVGTPGTTGVGLFQHAIEGDRTHRLQWGTSVAQPITLTFWTLSSVAGTIPVSIRNSASDRSYVVPITVQASVFELHKITVPGDTAGTWLTTPNSVGMRVGFGLCMGSNYNAPVAGAWQAGNYVSLAGALNVGGAVSRQLYISDLLVLQGNETPANPVFAMRPFTDEIELVKRYWRKSWQYATAFGVATYTGAVTVTGVVWSTSGVGGLGMGHQFDKPMRAAPTVTVASPVNGAVGQAATFSSGGGTQSGALNVIAISENGFLVSMGGLSGLTPGQPAEIAFQYAANARFT